MTLRESLRRIDSVIVVEDDGRSVKSRVPKAKQRGGLGIKNSEEIKKVERKPR